MVLSSAIDGIVAKNSELYVERLSGLSTIHTAVRGLQEAGIVDTTSEGTRIADPFFARFIRADVARVF